MITDQLRLIQDALTRTLHIPKLGQVTSSIFDPKSGSDMCAVKEAFPLKEYPATALSTEGGCCEDP